MPNMNLPKNISIFTGKVKAAANIATLLFLIVMGYTISRWHKVSGFDNLINVLTTILMLIMNIKFYKIYLNLHNASKLSEDYRIQSHYKLQKKEYGELVLMSLVMLAVIFMLNVIIG